MIKLRRALVITNPILKHSFIKRNVNGIKNVTEAANFNPRNPSVIYNTLRSVLRQLTDVTQTRSCVCNKSQYKVHLIKFQRFISYRQQTKISCFS